MLERALINFDVGVPGAIWRVVLGFLLVPSLRVFGVEPGLWTLALSLLSILFGVKVVAVVARRAVPATAVVRSHWEWRRNLARYHDSYQWRKLLWIGIGLAMGGAFGNPETGSQWVLGAVCILSGGAAEMLWRRHGLGVAPPSAA